MAEYRQVSSTKPDIVGWVWLYGRDGSLMSRRNDIIVLLVQISNSAIAHEISIIGSLEETTWIRELQDLSEYFQVMSRIQPENVTIIIIF